MKPNRWITPIGILLLLLLSLVPSGQTQNASPVSQTPGTPWQTGLMYSFTSNSGSTSPFDARGILYWKLVWVPDGTISACALNLNSSGTLGGSFSIGGIVSSATIGSCVSAGTYVTPSAVTPTNFGQITPAITGTGHMTVIIYGYTENPALSSGAASNVTITNFPATQPVSLASAPLPTGAATAANQVAPGTAGSPNANVQSIQGVSGMTPVKTDGSGVTQPVQPSGFSAVLSNQQSVTTSAVALASNASQHWACVKALSTNTISVFVGPTGITTATGYELAPGDERCYQVSNTNLLFVIAASGGASVSWTAQ